MKILDKLLMEIALRAWRRDLKKMYPRKSREEIDEVIHAVQNTGKEQKK